MRNETAAWKTPKRIVDFVTCYRNSRMKRLARIYKMPEEHPVRHITFAMNPPNPNLILPWIPPNRRVGRPRFKWVTETIKDMWNNIKHEHTHIPQTFDKDNQLQHEAIKESINNAASDPPFLFKTYRI